MSATLRLLSPDLPQPISLSVEPTMTILQVKESIMQQWPSGDAPHCDPLLRPAAVPCGPFQLRAGSSRACALAARAGAAVTPTQAQLRIIHQGKFLTDDKKLSGGLIRPRQRALDSVARPLHVGHARAPARAQEVVR